MLAGVCLYAAAHHLWIGVRRPANPMHAWFALLRLTVSCYVLAKLAAYTAVSGEALVATRRTKITLAFLALGMLTFIGPNHGFDYGLAFTAMPTPQVFTLPWGENIVDLRVLNPRPWFNVAWMYVLLCFVLAALFA